MAFLLLPISVGSSAGGDAILDPTGDGMEMVHLAAVVPYHNPDDDYWHPGHDHNRPLFRMLTSVLLKEIEKCTHCFYSSRRIVDLATFCAHVSRVSDWGLLVADYACCLLVRITPGWACS